MYEELKKAAECATQGEWQVIETKFPCRIGSPHIERRIFTVKDHPQLKGPYPVINGSVALGTEEVPVHHIVSISAQDAAFIAAANPSAVLALIAENEKLLARDKLHIELFNELSDFRRRTVEGFDSKVAALEAENEVLRTALTYIRDTSDDWHVCEKAADALKDSKDAG